MASRSSLTSRSNVVAAPAYSTHTAPWTLQQSCGSALSGEYLSTYCPRTSSNLSVRLSVGPSVCLLHACQASTPYHSSPRNRVSD
jgi:hypothetical protein